jgi:hypothetical protein
MTKFKQSLMAAIAVGTLLLPLPSVGAAPAEDKKGPRRFYLTTTRHFGNQALSACAAGYHTASLWEILDPTGLRYDTELGLTQADSGSGPPSSFGGWVRTGFNPGASLSPGSANCRAWTSAGSTDLGTVVSLHNLWETDAVKIVSPWFATTFACDSEVRVWCVED